MSVYVKDLIRMKVNANVMGVKNLVVVVEHVVIENYLVMVKNNVVAKKNMDMNIVMTEDGDFIEVQGTAEGTPLPRQQLDELLQLASHSIEQIIAQQKAALEEG